MSEPHLDVLATLRQAVFAVGAKMRIQPRKVLEFCDKAQEFLARHPDEDVYDALKFIAAEGDEAAAYLLKRLDAYFQDHLAEIVEEGFEAAVSRGEGTKTIGPDGTASYTLTRAGREIVSAVADRVTAIREGRSN